MLTIYLVGLVLSFLSLLFIVSIPAKYPLFEDDETDAVMVIIGSMFWFIAVPWILLVIIIKIIKDIRRGRR